MTNLHVPPAVAAAVHSATLRYARRAAIAVLVLLAVGGGLRFALNVKSAAALVQHNGATLQRTVITARATPGELVRTVALPSTLRGNTEASIYARSNGYLAAWHKSIGDYVKKGELLATIDAPEQEQELAQLKAAHQQIGARADLARSTVARWETLRLRDGVSQQELDEKRSELLQADADLAAAAANVKRLEQLQGFRRIVAPFSGVITRRGVEVGDLISAGSKELFALTQTDPLRLSIWVPQVYAGDVKIGAKVNIALHESQHRQLSATIERVAGGIDTQTRARQVDLILANPDATLLPGAYAEAHIELSSGVAALIAPASVLKTGADGFRIAVVNQANQIEFRPIKLGRDLGREVEVLAGIDATDTLVVSPSDLLAEGETVKTLAWEGKTSASEKARKKANAAANSTTNSTTDSTADSITDPITDPITTANKTAVTKS